MTQKEAIDKIVQLARLFGPFSPMVAALDKAVGALREQAERENDPLTLDELREMDGEPVRHGWWKLTRTMDTAEDALYCSQCKYIAWVGHGTSEHRTQYCPNCGAKMGKEDD